MEHKRLKLTFMRRLREQMKNSDINLTKLAKAIGAEPAAIHRLYHGKGLPSLPLARSLAIHFNVSLDYFAAVPFQGVKHER